ncbi:MAG: methyltransferase domain-containing protein, partial [Candidatus Woesearchaeota archaeon]
FQLSKQNIDLSKAEVLALFKNKSKLIDNLLILDSNEKYFDRLAYTKAIYQFLFVCKKNQLKNKIKHFNWNKYYKKNFCVRTPGMGDAFEREIASLVWKQIKNPKANLKHPKTSFYFFIAKNYVVCGLLLKELNERFEQRILLPAPYLPAAMHPRLARCMVNLTGIGKGTIVDPFCGAGGILLEAGLIGLNVVGYDIDAEMLKKAERNLKHFKIKHKLKQADATKLKNKIDYVVADLPYGKGTKRQNLEKLYSEFLCNLKKILGKRAVVCFPSFVNHQKLIKKAKLKLKQEFVYYLHKSLSRIICVIEP